MGDSKDVNTAFKHFNIFQQNLNYSALITNVLENSQFTKPKWFVNQLTILNVKRNKAHRKWKRDQDNKEKRDCS